MIDPFQSGHCFAEFPTKRPSVPHRSTLLVLLIIASLRPLAAQEKLLPVFHFQQVKGLPPVLVFSNVVRDSFGFVWFGTANGLCRYDGYTVKEYRNVELDPYSLPSKVISSLYCDSRKRLWVGTSNGKISVYDHRRDRFLNLRQIPRDSTKVNLGYFGRFLEDSNGNIWCTMQEGIIRIGLPARFNPLDIDSIAANVNYTNPHRNHDGGRTQSDCTKRGEFHSRNRQRNHCDRSGQADRLTPPLRQPTRPAARFFLINCLTLEPDGTLWVGTKTEGLYRLDWDRGTARNYRHHASTRLRSEMTTSV